MEKEKKSEAVGDEVGDHPKADPVRQKGKSADSGDSLDYLGASFQTKRPKQSAIVEMARSR